MTKEFKAELVSLVPHLRAFARSLTGHAATADDLAQETMLSAWKSRDKFEPGTNMKAWTFTILRNKFYSLKRRSWRSAPLDQELAENTIIAASNPEHSLALDDVRHAMTMLPDDQREALILIGASGLTYEEASIICRCKIGTIKSRVSRARKELEAILSDGDFSRDRYSSPAHEAFDAILNEARELAEGSV